MRVAASLWQVAVLAACSRLSAAQVPDTPDAPSPDKFIRRVHPRAAVMGNYIYFDGGAVNKENITEDLSINPPARAVSSTLSIDLTRPWSPETVVMKATAKSEDHPLMNSGGIFVNPSGQGSFYVYGGIQTFVQSPPAREDLWKFRPDGNGSGTWITETPSNGDFFNAMVRTSFGTWVSSPGAGFWIGGLSDERTTRSPEDRGPRGDILSYNFTDNSWAKDSSAGLSPDGTLYGASATFVPTFGPNGIIVVLGGTSQYDRPGEGHQPMDDVRFFDPVTKEIFRQTTSGQAPSERRHQCSVGVQGPDGTYEIFIYGGTSLDNKGGVVDEVWILSLPGFFWTKADYTAEFPRVGHDCVAAGRRQLVSIGGFDNNDDRRHNSVWWRFKDNFPQGLGVFDLTELKWKDSFDPEAAEYESPEPVKAWYKDNDSKDISWTSDNVKAIFFPSSVPPGSGGNSPGGNNSNNDEKKEDEEKGSTPSPVAAIAGGVVGGVIGVAIAGFIFWFCRRRRRQSRQLEDSQQTHALQGGYKPPHSPAGDIFTDTPHASSSGHTPSPGWYGQPAPGSGHPGYAVQQPVQEVPKAELQGNACVHEMDGTSVPPRHY